MREFELFLALEETVRLHNKMVAEGNTSQLPAILQLKADLENELKSKHKVLSLEESLPKPEVLEDGAEFAPGSIPQPPTPPEGFELFQTWAMRMASIQAEVQEQFLVCKACPFYVRKPDTIPCRVFPGTLESLCPNNYTCAMVEFKHWTMEELHERIKETAAKHGVAQYEMVYKDDLEKLDQEKRTAFLAKIARRSALEAFIKFRGKEESLILLSRNLMCGDLTDPEKGEQN